MNSRQRLQALIGLELRRLQLEKQIEVYEPFTDQPSVETLAKLREELKDCESAKDYLTLEDTN
ncbi:hypothetical protein GCM10010912_16560 [Paenibacillus albidus]|uniref:Uncharacterized protein n=1 Tax=Paenibacillus albidus TaxID=2041023 RepID=A0A917FDY5_9BACL|nr:hypothetical protein [Paenibacillus albidus]GGF72134.1 hypothetical protein GCM10010912_16560 [Paenibacillus albidus]